MAKSPEAFRTISEAADEVGVAQHDKVLRTIESPAARALHWPDEGELAFPEPQHVLRHAHVFGRFGDGAEGLGPLGHDRARS